MSNTRTLIQLRTSVQIRGGYETSQDITTTVLNDIINEAIAELYDIIVAKWADYYTVLSSNIAIVANTASYAIPTDFYKLRKVEILISGSDFRKLYPHDLDVAHRYTSTGLSQAYRYRLQAGNLVLVPTPTVAGTMRIYYIPFAARLTSDSDTFDGINNYEELVIQLALKRCKAREELDTSDIEREIERLSQRVRQSSDGRDAEPFYLDPNGPPIEDIDDEEWNP